MFDLLTESPALAIPEKVYICYIPRARDLPLNLPSPALHANSRAAIVSTPFASVRSPRNKSYRPCRELFPIRFRGERLDEDNRRKGCATLAHVLCTPTYRYTRGWTRIMHVYYKVRVHIYIARELIFHGRGVARPIKG